jgi:hypothetical protein
MNQEHQAMALQLIEEAGLSNTANDLCRFLLSSIYSLTSPVNELILEELSSHQDRLEG